MVFFSAYTFGQTDTVQQSSRQETRSWAIDSTFQTDSLRADTLNVADTLAQDSVAKSSEAIESPVAYKAADSVSFDLRNKKVFLYSDSEIDYEQINLKADRIEIEFQNDIINAFPGEDSLGREIGVPVFTEGAKEYKSHYMRYNYKTKKGLIRQVKTKEGEGFLHGNLIKKMPDNTINVKKGSYTTCDLDHPHYEIRYTKAKVIPKDKIVSGPAYLVIEDVPLPLILPFGFFPNKQGQQSGILIPSYGESAKRGFYFENGGYYWGINDYMDMEVRGDIYTHGSWAIEPQFRYSKRYGFNGTIRGGYTVNKMGEEGTADYSVSKDFKFYWQHSQDPKARPNSRFNANVNIVSSTYNSFNPVNTQDYLSNTFSSSISYSTSFLDHKINLSASASHSQNTLTRAVSIRMPELSLSVNKFYPLKKKERVGKSRWYEKISVDYSMAMKNQIDTYDTLLTFDNEMWKNFRNGMQHRVSVSSPVKLLKHFTWTNSLTLTDRLYTNYIKKSYLSDTLIIGTDTLTNTVLQDTVQGFQMTHEYSLNSSLNTTIYGMVNFRKGPVKAIRHVMNPSISFSYKPDFSLEKYGYYDSYYDEQQQREIVYSLYERGIYGTPSQGKSGSISFGLSNNFEMKVRTPNDSTQEDKKIKLIDNLSFNTSYNLAADSLNWSTLSVSGRTKLFKKLDITYRSTYDPYALDSNGRRINKFVWDTDGKLLRRDNTTWSFSLNFNFSDADFKPKKDNPDDSSPERDQRENTGPQGMTSPPERNYVRWDNSWSAGLSYSLRRTNTFQKTLFKYKTDIVQSLNFNTSVNITNKWKFQMRSGYDFVNKQISYTSINLHRDLHCWEMTFNWIPLGARKSWNFTIRAKSAILQDLKLERKKDFRDY
jgi:lipopolysaccharide assembly outer membrane protein LptD (OstA)